MTDEKTPAEVVAPLAEAMPKLGTWEAIEHAFKLAYPDASTEDLTTLRIGIDCGKDIMQKRSFFGLAWFPRRELTEMSLLIQEATVAVVTARMKQRQFNKNVNLLIEQMISKNKAIDELRKRVAELESGAPSLTPADPEPETKH